MTWSDHMTEIARQGIWASLTGGWYYEPTHSLFCNTVHLYLWLVFFLLPLLLGLRSANIFSASVLIYFGTIIVLFLCIKLIVMYLHKIDAKVFDTSEPIVVTKPKEPHKLIAEQRRANARHLESARMYERFYEMIEMHRLESRVEQDIASAQEENRQRMRYRERRASAPIAVSHAVSSSSVNDNNNATGATTADSHAHTCSRFRRVNITRERVPTAPRSFAHVLERKLSEPILSQLATDAGDETEEGEVLVTSSLCADLDKGSTHSLRNMRDTDWERRKTFKIGPDEKEDDSGEHVLKIEEIEEDAAHQSDKEEYSAAINTIPIEPNVKVSSPDIVDIEEGDLKRVVDKMDEDCEKDDEQPSTSRALVHFPDVPSTSTGIGLPVERQLSQTDLTRFLEELIDRHPATLEAIESVREKRRREEAERPAETPTPAPKKHVASTHNDTTEGAMHSFQDDKGTWWTYMFDENGFGTAQEIGNAAEIMALLGDVPIPLFPGEPDTPYRPRINTSHFSISTMHQRPPAHLFPIPESSEDDESDSQPVDSVRVTRRRCRHRRRSSSSSNEGQPYLSSTPSSVLFAAGQAATTRRPASGSGNRRTRAPRPSNPSVSFGGGLASRLRASLRSDEREIDVDERRERPRSRVGRPDNPSLEQLLPHMTEADRMHLASRIAAAEMNTGASLSMPPNVGDMLPRKARSVSNTKKKYYYHMNIVPFMKNSLKIKMDRLSLAALFDRNRSVFSLIFDVILAAILCITSTMILTANIYHDISLVGFAFVTASAHFSLLKSVQPDASSPTHGFNWQVAYSRPFYFLVLSSTLLTLNSFLPKDPELLPWNWNIYRFSAASIPSVIMAFRDLAALLILFIPITCTVGWMPQVSTLIHHVLEQVEMIILGGTASFGALSALLQLCRTVTCVAILVAVSLFANSIDHSTFDALPMALLVQISFLHSRFSSNPHLWKLIVKSLKLKGGGGERTTAVKKTKGVVLCGASVPLRDERGEANEAGGDDGDEDIESLPNDESSQASENRRSEKLGDLPPAIRVAALTRAKRDFIFSFLLFLVTFAVYCTSVLTATQPYISMSAIGVTFAIGIINHYLFVHLRKHTPWKLIARPILRAEEYGMYEADHPATLMCFEKIHMWMLIVEKNVLYPLTVVSSLAASSRSLCSLSPILLPIMGFRLLRSAMSHPQLVYIPLGLSFLLSYVDLQKHSPFSLPVQASWLDIFPYVWYILAVLYPKWEELSLKLHFVLAYIAPWQITWGSAFHAFAQPFSVPHSILIALQTAISSILSAPLNPFLGSSFITASYVRPVKFWERDYNTERSDASNTKLASQIERGPMLDDSNLNAVFYEHLTRSLQSAMAGDMALGRWGASIRPGDCFILASFYLNCLVHIIEVGNGFVTFQLRGLEFRGTYCHQREVEAISEDTTEGAGCCCCSPGSLPGVLSLNSAWNLRWLAWEVTSSKLIIDGYSITDNSAISLLQVHELRRLLVTLYCRCIIFYAVTSKKLMDWLQNETISATLDGIEKESRYVDVDHMFHMSNDEDYDLDLMGISRQSFLRLYSTWIDFCITKNPAMASPESSSGLYARVQSLCYALSLLGRRALGAAAFNRHSNAAESFLYGLHSLFKGDFRITCTRDEWVFADMDLLRCVISPSVRMAVKLHQDHFTVADDLEDSKSLYYVIRRHQAHMFISHEHDPAWREAIMANTPSLLALRHMYDDGQDDYKIIMLNKMQLNMRVIKLNRECVRAFWAGQQQELVFLRNRNPERGSIQNARQVLRNMINSSADQPVGYPIYVSPLTTSFIETHQQYDRIVGQPLTLESFISPFRSAYHLLRSHLGMTGSSGLGGPAASVVQRAKREPAGAAPLAPPPPATSTIFSTDEPIQMEQSFVQLTADGARVSIVRKSPKTRRHFNCREYEGISALGNVLSRSEMECVEGIVEVTKDEEVFRHLHEPMKATGEMLVVWPKEEWRLNSGKEKSLMTGERGVIVHTWYPNHQNRALRSHNGETIRLILLFNSCTFMPVSDKGLRRLPETTPFKLGITFDSDEDESAGRRRRTKSARRRADKEAKRERKKWAASISSPPPSTRRLHKRTHSGTERVGEADCDPSTPTSSSTRTD